MRAKVRTVAIAMAAAMGGCSGWWDGSGIPPEAPPITETDRPPPPPAAPPPGYGRPDPRWPALQQEVERFALNFGPETAAIVYDMTRGRVDAPGTFVTATATYPVMLRQRGDGARYHPKHSWKVELPQGSTLHGIRRLNFLAEYLDAGYLTDLFSYRLMEAAGVPAARPRYAELSVNGEHQGVYTVLEQVDKHFLRAHGLDEDSSIYRCGARDCELKITPPAHYQDPWEKKTNEAEPFADLEAFLQSVSRTPEHELLAFLERHLDLDAYLRYLAVNTLIGNAGIDDSGSYLIHDRGRDRWVFVPWDLNNCHMQFWRNEPLDEPPRVRRAIPVYTAYDPVGIRGYEWKEAKYGDAHLPFSVLTQRIWDVPVLRNRVLDHVEKLMDTVFSPAQANAQIDAQAALIRPLLAADPWVDPAHAARAPRYLKEYVRGRIDYLRQAIPAERRRGEDGLVISALAPPGLHPDDRGEPSGFIELYNRGGAAVALGGKVITDDLRSQFQHRLPAGLTIPPHGSLVLWADGQPEQGPRHLPFRLGEASGGEVGLFDGVTMIGVLDALFYSPLPPGREYRRVTGDSEQWNWSPPR